jgi:hypothetical protein
MAAMSVVRFKCLPTMALVAERQTVQQAHERAERDQLGGTRANNWHSRAAGSGSTGAGVELWVPRVRHGKYFLAWCAGDYYSTGGMQCLYQNNAFFRPYVLGWDDLGGVCSSSSSDLRPGAGEMCSDGANMLFYLLVV